MTFTLTKTQPRLWSIDAGVAMVVTDLHGDGDAYERYCDRFIQLRAQGQADCLVFTGDLLHQRSPEVYDASLDIVLDIMAMQAVHGDAIIALCGNHELPHIYGFGLSKGGFEYTPAFEQALSASPHRAAVTKFLLSLPFYIRTQAGVSLTHAGAADGMAEPENARQVFEWDHVECLAQAEKELAKEDVPGLRGAYSRMSGEKSYDALVAHYLGVQSPNDPRYDHLLRGFFAMSVPSYSLVHNALFTKCERSYGDEQYEGFLDLLLQHLAQNYEPQRVLVAGHMTIPGGHLIVGKQHLRLASAHHATPREAGQYLLFDTARPVQSPEELLHRLGSVFDG